ncbi:hypothetical protein L917_18707 [Phytophthora nicotianae]|uniref:Aromatic amino acid beta-eliminating lyase/threonine aldolase domain-containing protein n=2 Tax=Phytophthora nicotianae TaxID=4792 RepID=W2K6V1_PHYNI|nr:hypothetical protein L917_18707 [Phytophthora nicotianae]
MCKNSRVWESVHPATSASAPLPALQPLHFQIIQLEPQTKTMAATRRVINFMSDTITCPTPGMRKAMAAAKVGDDVYGLDPTVKQLQKVVASMLGKEDAMFVPSGTMSNLIAIGMHCQRGDEVICGNKSHIFTYEGAGASAYMGVSLATLPNQPDGTIKLSDMARAVRADDIHYPRTSLVEIENTHNTCGGRVLPLSYIRDVENFCKEHNLSLHVDGARLANASVASGVALEDLVKGADTVSFCLSKGLGAPIGSILAGSEEFIHQAKRLRKSLGGGLRQSGVVAAGALYGLEHQFDRLAEDHENAKTLAHGLSTIPGIEIDVNSVDTNMLFFKVSSDCKIDTQTLVKKVAEEKGIVFGGYWRGEEIRAVTNLHVTSGDVEYTIASVRDVLAASESNFQVA